MSEPKLPAYVCDEAVCKATEAFPVPWDDRKEMLVLRQNYIDAFKMGARLVLDRLKATEKNDYHVKRFGSQNAGPPPTQERYFDQGRESIRREVLDD